MATSSEAPVVSLSETVHNLTAFSEEDKQRILSTLAASEYYTSELGSEGQHILQSAPDWTHVRTVSGVEITKQAAIAPEQVPKFRAAGIVKASVKDVKEFVLNQELMPKYDPLFKQGQWLQLFHEEATGLFKGFNHGFLGMSGVSAVCWDRDFVVLAVGMDLPNGGFVVHMTSLDDGHAKAVAPVTGNHVVRGRIPHSSWVACPLQDGTTHVTNILQVDLKGSVPGFMTHMYGRTMATSMRRIEKEISNMPPAMLESYRRKRKMLWDRTMRHPPHAQATRTCDGTDGRPATSRSFGAVHPVDAQADSSRQAGRFQRSISMFSRRPAQATA